jgi:hypothetical protein
VIAKLSEVEWEKCVTKVDSQLTSKQIQCIKYCTERYLDTRYVALRVGGREERRGERWVGRREWRIGQERERETLQHNSVCVRERERGACEGVDSFFLSLSLSLSLLGQDRCKKRVRRPVSAVLIWAKCIVLLPSFLPSFSLA